MVTRSQGAQGARSQEPGVMVTRSQGQGARSNSCLTSAHSDYQAWRQARRHETAVVKKMTGPGGSLTSSCNSSSSSNSSAAAAAAAAGKQGASKLLGRLSQSMMANMKRSNSFHHENLQNSQNTASKENEPRTYRPSDDYCLGEDELFLPLYPTEEEPVDTRPARKDQLSALDSLGNNTIYNTSNTYSIGNVSHFSHISYLSSQ